MSRNFQELTIKDSFMFAAVMSDEKGSKRRFNVEMQVKRKIDLPWLPDELYRYTYETVCRENGVPLNQGQKTVFLSTKGRNEDDVPKELVDFLKYVGDPDNLPKDVEDVTTVLYC